MNTENTVDSLDWSDSDWEDIRRHKNSDRPLTPAFEQLKLDVMSLVASLERLEQENTLVKSENTLVKSQAATAQAEAEEFKTKCVALEKKVMALEQQIKKEDPSERKAMRSELLSIKDDYNGLKKKNKTTNNGLFAMCFGNKK